MPRAPVNSRRLLFPLCTENAEIRHPTAQGVETPGDRWNQHHWWQPWRSWDEKNIKSKFFWAPSLGLFELIAHVWEPHGNLVGTSRAPLGHSLGTLNIGIRIVGKRNLEPLAQILLRKFLSLKYDFSCQRYEFLYWGFLGGAQEAPVRFPRGAHEAPKHVQLIRKGLNLELKKVCS